MICSDLPHHRASALVRLVSHLNHGQETELASSAIGLLCLPLGFCDLNILEIMLEMMMHHPKSISSAVKAKVRNNRFSFHWL
jgi:hypothetical protein